MKSISINKKSDNMQKIFIVCYSLLYLRNILGHTYLESGIYRIISFLCPLVLLFKLLIAKRSTRENFFVFILAVIGVAVYMETKSYLVLLNFVIIFSSQGINRKKLFNILVVIGVITSILVVFLSIIGAIENKEVMGSLAYGFTNPNQAMSVISISVIMIICVYVKDINIMQWYFLCLFTLGWAILTESRAVYLVLVVMFLLNTIYKFKKQKYFHKIMWEYVFLIGLIFFLFLIFKFEDNIFLAAINNIMTGRLLQANYYYQLYDIKWFGNFIPELNGENHWPWYTIDCSYAYLFIVCGWIYGILHLYFIFRAIRIYRKKEDVGAIFALLLVSVYMLMENTAIWVIYCPLLMLLNVREPKQSSIGRFEQ